MIFTQHVSGKVICYCVKNKFYIKRNLKSTLFDCSWVGPLCVLKLKTHFCFADELAQLFLMIFKKNSYFCAKYLPTLQRHPSGSSNIIIFHFALETRSLQFPYVNAHIILKI